MWHEELSENQMLNNYQRLFPNANLNDLQSSVPSLMAHGCEAKLLLEHAVRSQFKPQAAFPAFLNSTVGTPCARHVMGIPEVLPNFAFLVERAKVV